VYELGIEFYEPTHRGRGLGSQVLQIFIPRVFDNHAIRLQGRTHIENTAMIRLFREVRLRPEGILRDIWPLEGVVATWRSTP
jgi:RimJ/RimL family protein N-acetyltransferase